MVVKIKDAYKDILNNNMEQSFMEESRGTFTDWFTSGIDQQLAGHGGPGCNTYRSYYRRVGESVLLLATTLLLVFWSLKRIRGLESGVVNGLKKSTGPASNQVSASRQAFLAAFCVMFGCQVGFKLASKTLIFLLQPCHVTTSLQIYLLAAPVHKHTTTIFRIHCGFLNGGFLALLFPVLDTYSLPFELELYYIQHGLMVIVPVYLSSLGEPYTLEPIKQVYHSVLSYCAFMLYHILVLQPVSFYTGVNINNVLCPAPSDPFAGPNYILHASWTQLIVIVAACKYVKVGSSLLHPSSPGSPGSPGSPPTHTAPSTHPLTPSTHPSATHKSKQN